jgi:hypothetical protein
MIIDHFDLSTQLVIFHTMFNNSIILNDLIFSFTTHLETLLSNSFRQTFFKTSHQNNKNQNLPKSLLPTPSTLSTTPPQLQPPQTSFISTLVKSSVDDPNRGSFNQLFPLIEVLKKNFTKFSEMLSNSTLQKLNYQDDLSFLTSKLNGNQYKNEIRLVYQNVCEYFDVVFSNLSHFRLKEFSKTSNFSPIPTTHLKPTMIQHYKHAEQVNILDRSIIAVDLGEFSFGQSMYPSTNPQNPKNPSILTPVLSKLLQLPYINYINQLTKVGGCVGARFGSQSGGGKVTERVPTQLLTRVEVSRLQTQIITISNELFELQIKKMGIFSGFFFGQTENEQNNDKNISRQFSSSLMNSSSIHSHQYQNNIDNVGGGGGSGGGVSSHQIYYLPINVNFCLIKFRQFLIFFGPFILKLIELAKKYPICAFLFAVIFYKKIFYNFLIKLQWFYKLFHFKSIFFLIFFSCWYYLDRKKRQIAFNQHLATTLQSVTMTRPRSISIRSSSIQQSHSRSISVDGDRNSIVQNNHPENNLESNNLRNDFEKKNNFFQANILPQIEEGLDEDALSIGDLSSYNELHQFNMDNKLISNNSLQEMFGQNVEKNAEKNTQINSHNLTTTASLTRRTSYPYINIKPLHGVDNIDDWCEVYGLKKDDGKFTSQNSPEITTTPFSQLKLDLTDFTTKLKTQLESFHHNVFIDPVVNNVNNLEESEEMLHNAKLQPIIDDYEPSLATLDLASLDDVLNEAQLAAAQADRDVEVGLFGRGGGGGDEWDSGSYG